MELYHNNMSVCAQKVRMVIAEKQLKPTLHHKYLRNGDTHTPEYLALNPNGVVPTLIDHGVPIIESTIICEYLDDAYPQHPLRPEDPVQRALMRRWTQSVDTGIHGACGQISIGVAWRHQMQEAQIERRASDTMFIDLVRKGPESAFMVSALGTFEKLLTRMDGALRASPWLLGDRFTLADNAMVPYILRLHHLEIGWMWADRPVIADWLVRAQQRDAYQGISDYLDPEYVALARDKGTEARGLLQSIVAGIRA